jgi:hypothetical protein
MKFIDLGFSILVVFDATTAAVTVIKPMNLSLPETLKMRQEKSNKY